MIVLKYDASVSQDALNLTKQLQKEHGVTYLDVVVANAGIAKAFPLVRDVKRVEVQEHLEVNVFGVVELFQATREMLQRSERKEGPIFAVVGSGAGALGYVTLFSLAPTTSNNEDKRGRDDLRCGNGY